VTFSHPDTLPHLLEAGMVPGPARELLNGLLHHDADKRMTVAQALKTRFLDPNTSEEEVKSWGKRPSTEELHPTTVPIWRDIGAACRALPVAW
jgi:hypothetical protein